MSDRMTLREALCQTKRDVKDDQAQIEAELWGLVEANLSPPGLQAKLKQIREDLHKYNYQRAVIQQIEILTGETF